jgi:NADPH:quinone reductase-like Zn-dependent oxidoreductase
MGLLVADGFPVGLGVDAAGVVVKVGDQAGAKFKVGDEVCGCTRLGTRGYNTAQEFFLMDAPVTMPKPKNITIQQAATVGVGAETACLGIFNGLAVEVPGVDKLPPERDEWLVVLGGASSVGKFAIQIAAACGFKVIASCSAHSTDVVRDLDAAMFDYKKPVEEQVKDVMAATGGKFTRVFDAVASNDALARALFKELETHGKATGPKYFATTNDWSGIGDFEGGTTYAVALGPVGRPEATELNARIGHFIPLMVGLIEQDKVSPSAYDIVGQGGLEDAIEAYKYQQKGAGGSNKVLVKIQDK